MNIRPLHDRIVARRIESAEEVRGGIIIPESAKDDIPRGKVLAVGQGVPAGKGFRPPVVRVGDVVLLSNEAVEVGVNGQRRVAARNTRIGQQQPVAFPTQFDLLAHDQRGLGRSEKPDARYSMADYAEDAAALLDHEGWPRCRVVGVSFGGMVAQELAARYPARIERLVLCCTSSGGAGGASYPLHELEALPPEERSARSLELGDTRLDAAWRAAHPEDWTRLRGLLEGLWRGR